jgi:hypothetical protein
MTNQDIDAFLAAKRQIRWIERVQIAVLVVAFVAVAMAVVIGIDDRSARDMLLGAVITAAVLNVGARSASPRDRLIELLERQINNDPEALRYLAAMGRPH